MSKFGEDWYVVEVTPFGTAHLYGPLGGNEAWDLEESMAENHQDDGWTYFSVTPRPVEELRG